VLIWLVLERFVICISAGTPDILTRFRGCSQAFQANASIVGQFMLRLLDPKSFPTHYSLILLFDAAQFGLLTASLKLTVSMKKSNMSGVQNIAILMSQPSVHCELGLPIFALIALFVSTSAL
jgi:hypothetical protein